MKHLGIGIVTAIAMTGAGSAALAQPPTQPWTGFYAGLNAGGVGSTGSHITNTGTDTDGGGLGFNLGLGNVPAFASVSDSGALGGAQIGYNWQSGAWLFGVEADADAASSKSSQSYGPNTFGGQAAQTTVFTRELDGLETVRARVGYFVAPSVVIYGTGGSAFGQAKLGNQWICPTCGPATSTESSTAHQTTSTLTGWAAGGGFEWKFASKWSLKAEYLYADLGSETSTITYAYPPDTSTLTSHLNEQEQLVRVGANYHF